jgi:divalent metal cation (Fe/Co/Zn/Cd) transporter
LHFTLAKGYEAADDWAALFASGFILYNSYKIFRPALGEIMDEHVYDDLVANIRKIALTVNGVMGTEKCFIRKAGMIYHVDLHATVAATISVKAGHDIAHQLKDTLRREIPQLGHVLIHIEPHQE